jgi:hypothetical protein
MHALSCHCRKEHLPLHLHPGKRKIEKEQRLAAAFTTTATRSNNCQKKKKKNGYQSFAL